MVFQCQHALKKRRVPGRRAKAISYLRNGTFTSAATRMAKNGLIRKGRNIAGEALRHHPKNVVALHETIRLMKETDATFEIHEAGL